MTLYLVSLSFLIAVVLLLRAVFQKSVSPRVIYALWLAVVLRMLLPITPFEMHIPFPDFFAEEQATQEGTDVTHSPYTDAQTPSSPIETVPSSPVQAPTQITPTVPSVPEITPATPEQMPPTVSTNTTTPMPEQKTVLDWKQIANAVWLSGAVIVGAWTFFAYLSYGRRLRKGRRLYKTVNKTKVYISPNADVPCIAGLIPSIYITPETASGDAEALTVIHEYTHLRHGDHIWSAVRTLALTVFWWNPLVWAAASASKKDAELACDDAVAAKLSEETRLKYARILLDTVPQRRHYAVGLGSAPLKERILMLTKRQKNKWLCLLLTLVLCGTAVGCSFVHLSSVEDTDTQNDVFESTDSTQTEPSTSQLTEYLPLTPTLSSDKVSLYYGVDDPSSIMASEFFIVFGKHEARIRTTMPAWLEGTWEPQLYLNDMELPGVSADGTEDAVLILTTGTGTGVHTEEAYVIDGASGLLTVIEAPYKIAEQAVKREEDGKCSIADSDGHTIALPNNAYFEKHFKFCLGAKALYAEVHIGYGMLSYIEDHIRVTYGADGITWDYVDQGPTYTESTGAMRTHGPFFGYVADRETPWIDLYTGYDGTYVASIPYEIFHDWIATDRESESWTAGWMSIYIHFYYAEFGDFRWAAVHLVDTVLGSGRKNIATSTDGGLTWSFGSTRDDYGGNHVVGMGFASESIAFMSFEPNNEYDGAQGPVISRTTDGGKTWALLDIPVPAAFAGDKLISGSPFYDGDVFCYPVWAEPSHGTKIGDAMYLVSYDKGLTWSWDEASVAAAAAKYVSIPITALDWQDVSPLTCTHTAVKPEDVVSIDRQSEAGPFVIIETKDGMLFAAKENASGYSAFYQIDTPYKDTVLLESFQNVLGRHGLRLSYTVGANASEICYFTLDDNTPTLVLTCNKDAAPIEDMILEAYGSMGAQINLYRQENGAVRMCDLNRAIKEIFPTASTLYLHRVSGYRYHSYRLAIRIEIPENTYDYYGWISNGALHLISEELLDT